MRYEDASHTGAFTQDSGPDARNDADAIAAGAKGPATGNVITGEGTQTGPSGSDYAPGAHITSIAGAGGEDSSFAGGRLAVSGEFGRLSIDAEGNYSYQPKANTPENSVDRFTYTLADSQGAADTATLTIEIGKTPAVIKANAQQVVPGPDGVVILPPGVELSDVHIVGRNLVIDLPDGSQMVIIDGAVFVPQLVLDGVEVPATNLAALLVGQEIAPAAGEGPPQSSGGNFNVPVPPLDPGVPLGDLIPPTEYGYQPPEVKEVFDLLDEEPEAGSTTALLDDDAQEDGNPLSNVGDDPGGSSANGFLPGSGGDGDLSWDLLPSGDLPTGFTFADQPNGDVWILQGGVHVITISIDPATGAYEVTQLQAITHPDGGNENNLLFTINYTVTDEDGDSATGSLVIDVDDDMPTVTVQASDDSQVVLTTDDADTIGPDSDSDSTTANFSGVFGGTSVVYGADGPGPGSSSTYSLAVTGSNSGLFSHGSAIHLFVVGGVVYGTTAASAGAISAGNTIFTVSTTNTGEVTLTQYQQIDHLNTDPSPTGAPYADHIISMADGLVTLTRSETAVDGDNDSVTGSATVNIGANLHFTDDGPSIDPTLNEVGGAVVDESEPVDDATIPLADGYTRGDDPDLSGGLAIGKGSTSGPVIDANASFGADGPANGGGISYALVVGNSVSGLTTTDGTAINLVELSNGVVVGVVDGTTTVAFAISIDSGTGVVTVEQYLSLFHPDSPNNFDEPVFLDEGSLGVTVTATDFDGDSVTSGAVDITSLIRFEDDGPSVDPSLNANATVTVDESLPSNTPGIDTGVIAKGDDPDLAGGLAIGQANSGSAIVSANAAFGADGPAAGGGISYALSITNPDPGVTLTDGTSITMQLVDGVIVGVVDSGPFDGKAAFAIAIDPTTGVVTVEQYLSLDHPVNPDPNDPLGLGDNTIAVNVTATDGDGDHITSDDVDISGQITFLDDGPSVAPTLNANATVTVDESLPSDTAGIDTGAIVKGNDPDLAGGLAIGQASSGGAIVDPHAVFGADGPAAGGGIGYELSITEGANAGVTLTDGTTIHLTNVNGVIVGVVDGVGTFGGQAAFAITIDPSSGVVTVEQYLSLDHPVNPDPNDPLGLGDNTVGVIVTATDGDGDPVTSDAVDISHQITFLDDGPSADPVLDQEATITVDESLPSAAAVIDTMAIIKGNDPDLSDATGTAIGSGNSGSAIIDVNAIFGADGPAAGGGINYALSILNASSGVTLTDGTAINLQLLDNGVVVGVVASGALAGQAAFAIAINPTTGVVSLEQYLSLDHPVNPDPNDPLGLGENTLGVTATVTDGDGDPITTDAVDISSNITFLDDGPTADPTVNADATVTVDESLPSTAPGINTGAILKGDDPDLPGGLALGQANSGVAIVNANAVFGADGPAAAGSLTYGLEILDVSSGLTLTDGTPIDLVMVNGVIVGVVDGGTFDGKAAFAIAIDSTTGVVTVEQYLSLDHPVNPDPNDPLSFGEDVIGATVTVTDGDGDPVTSDAVDIGGQLTFLDDGPVANDDVDSIVGGNGPATGNVITGVEVAVGEDANATDGVADAVGADGDGRITFIDHSDIDPGKVVPNGGSVQIDGDYGVLTIYSNGDYSYLRNDGTPGGVSDVFTYTLADGDGDTTTATLTIGIDDNFPTLPDPALIRLDDDVIPGKGGNVDGPGDDDPDAVPGNVVDGQLNGSGGDGPLTYNFTGDDTLPPGFSIGAASDDDTLIIVQDQNGSPVTVMTIQLTQSDGSFTVTQNNPILHDPTNPGADPGQEGNFEDNLTFSIGVEVEDADHDVEPAHITINVDDDTPTINVTKGADAGVILTTDDADTIGVATDTASTSANFGGVFGLTQSAGADGTNTAATLQFALDVTGYTGGPAGVNSGLESNDNDIFLYEIGGKVVGSTSATLVGVIPGNTIFDVSVSNTGVVTLTQYQQIDHDTVDPSPTGAPFADHIVSLTDSLITLTAAATLTDKDGDTVTDSEVVNIGANLRFTDDGPDANTSATAVGSVTLDETRAEGTDTAGGSAPTGDALATIDFSVNFVNGASVDYGADGPGSTVYKLSLTGTNVNSGLFALDTTDIETVIDGYGQGSPIVLNINGAGTQITGSVGATNYFTITIDPATGVVTFEQLNNIWHPTAGSTAAAYDDNAALTTLTADLIKVVQTVTDFDGDTDTASINIGQGVFNIQDDGPRAFNPADATLTNAPGSAVNFALDPIINGGDNNILNNLGTDGGLVRINASIDNTDSGMTSGGAKVWYILSDDGQTLVGKTGTSAANAEASGTTIFTVHIDQANSQYSVDMDGTIDAFTTVNFTDTDFDFIGGNKGWFGIVPNGQTGAGAVDDDSRDLYITPLNDTSINTSGILGGVDTGQSVGAGEGFRIDYVIDLTADAGAPPNDFTNGADNGANFNQGDVGTHWTTNGAFVTMRQSTGSDIRLQAFDDTDADNIVGDGVQDTITGIRISYNGASSVLLTPTAGVQNVTVGGVEFTYKLDADLKSVIVTNVQGNTGANETPATTVAVFTADGYTSLEIEHVAGDTFKFSGFGAIVQNTDPVVFHLPVQIIDGDGDIIAATSTIDVTLNPAAPPVVLDLNGDGAHFVGQGAGVHFDYGAGLVATAWAGPDDGILVRDANGNGTVDSASEFVFGGNGQTDLQALAAQYGETLDANDADFAKFGVWQDANSNGVVDAGEFSSLTAKGITSINLVSNGNAYNAAGGEVAVAGSATYVRADGSTGVLADAAFATGSRAANDERVLSTSTSNIALAAAVAAAGLAGGQQAAASAPDVADHGQDVASTASGVGPAVAAGADDAAEARSMLSNETKVAANDEAQANSSSPGDAGHGDSQGLDPAAAHGQAEVSPLVAPVDPGPSMDVAAAGPVAPAVAMVSAEALQAAGVDGTAKHGGEVEKVLADALGHDGPPTVDGLLQALGGHGGGQLAAISHVASPAADAVPAWDMGTHGAFVPGADMMFKMGAEMLHHDAVQPVVNG